MVRGDKMDFNEVWAAIVKMAVKQARQITDDKEALEVQCLYKQWEKQIGRELTVGEYINYNGVLYKVLQRHIVQEQWTPAASPSLFAKVLVDPTGETILEWEQPDSTNPYMKGDKVTHNGITYVCDIDNNVWEPGVYGWSVVQ